VVKLSSNFGRPESGDKLAYTGEIETVNDVAYHVIDIENTDFSNAPLGRKKGTTIVLEAKGGEHTAQVFGTTHETVYPYTAKKGDAIFIQGNLEQSFEYLRTGKLPEGVDALVDIYVPDDAKFDAQGEKIQEPTRGRLQFANLEKEGFGIAESYEAEFGGEQVKGILVTSRLAHVLKDANAVPACIKIEGKQLKLFEVGSMFKILDGFVSGTNREVADTWEIPEVSIAQKPAPAAGRKL